MIIFSLITLLFLSFSIQANPDRSSQEKIRQWKKEAELSTIDNQLERLEGQLQKILEQQVNQEIESDEQSLFNWGQASEDLESAKKSQEKAKEIRQKIQELKKRKKELLAK